MAPKHHANEIIDVIAWECKSGGSAYVSRCSTLYNINMNVRSGVTFGTFLIFCVPLIIFAVPTIHTRSHGGTQFQEPTVSLVGNWRVVPGCESSEKDAFYHFWADGTFNKRVRQEALAGPNPDTVRIIENESYKGHYEISKDNQLTLSGDWGLHGGLKLHPTKHGLIVGYGQRNEERWYRVK